VDSSEPCDQRLPAAAFDPGFEALAGREFVAQERRRVPTTPPSPRPTKPLPATTPQKSISAAGAVGADIVAQTFEYQASTDLQDFHSRFGNGFDVVSVCQMPIRHEAAVPER
jgi:hypothetical protein